LYISRINSRKKTNKQLELNTTFLLTRPCGKTKKSYKTMDSEFENKQEMQSTENESTREGYRAPEQNNSYSGYRSVGRSPRPRIHAQRPYNTNRVQQNNNDEGGFRPEGFGAGLQQGGQQRSFVYIPGANHPVVLEIFRSRRGKRLPQHQLCHGLTSSPVSSVRIIS
jgi:hypothetical protein